MEHLYRSRLDVLKSPTVQSFFRDCRVSTRGAVTPHQQIHPSKMPSRAARLSVPVCNIKGKTVSQIIYVVGAVVIVVVLLGFLGLR